MNRSPHSTIAAAFRETRRDVKHGANALAAVLRLQMHVASQLSRLDPKFVESRFHAACKGDEK